MFDLPSIPVVESSNTIPRATSGSLSATRTTQKGTGAGGGATNMRDLLRHEGQEVFDRPALDTPHWKLPKRVRGETYELMKQKEGLRNGFQGLLQGNIRDDFVASSQSGGNPDVEVRRALKNVGDRSRKHFDERPSDERPWKPGFKTTVPDILPARPRGKRPVPFDTMVGNDYNNNNNASQQQPLQPTSSSTTPVAAVAPSQDNKKDNNDHYKQSQSSSPPSAFTNKPGGYRQRVPHEEIGDLPRGRKHARPINQTGNNINGNRLYGGQNGATQQQQDSNIVGETALFKPKKVVVDGATGVPRSWQGPPFFDTAVIEEHQRKEEVDRKRRLREQLSSDTLIGGHAARAQRIKPNMIAPSTTNGGASPSIDKLGFTGGSKVLAPSTGGGGSTGAGTSGRRGDVTGLVMGVSSGGGMRGAGGGAPVDMYARKEARIAIAKDISDVKSLPSY